MSETISRIPAYLQIQTATSHIWNHRLVNDLTRQHRMNGIEAFNRMVAKTGILQSDVIGLLFGSSAAIPDISSDYDFVVVASDITSYSAMVDLQEAKFYKGEDQYNIDLLLSYCIDPHLREQEEFREILLTPDEYIAGSLNLAHFLRLEMAKLFWERAIKFESEDETPQSLKYILLEHYFNWPFLPKNDEVDQPDVLIMRMKRFRGRVREVQKSSRDPVMFMAQLLANLTDFRLPTARTYYEGLMASQGRLTIH